MRKFTSFTGCFVGCILFLPIQMQFTAGKMPCVCNLCKKRLHIETALIPKKFLACAAVFYKNKKPLIAAESSHSN
ncbi:hypothetical protein C7N43_26525 [Sphingobacteriales bacterium UPWRP_1]|nr:hypothetical protein B6N25_14165 [Sphingobacteriales bacterium TSM_CSS]PSJ73954.1 hypothetical protein C7N43_26525 [Sphingobacteriales bacterium UPWRP_1]